MYPPQLNSLLMDEVLTYKRCACERDVIAMGSMRVCMQQLLMFACIHRGVERFLSFFVAHLVVHYVASPVMAGLQTGHRRKRNEYITQVACQVSGR